MSGDGGSETELATSLLMKLTRARRDLLCSCSAHSPDPAGAETRRISGSGGPAWLSPVPSADMPPQAGVPDEDEESYKPNLHIELAEGVNSGKIGELLFRIWTPASSLCGLIDVVAPPRLRVRNELSSRTRRRRRARARPSEQRGGQLPPH